MPLLKRGGLRLVQSVPFVSGARSQAVTITPGARFVKRLWAYIKAVAHVTGGTGAGTISTDGGAILARLFEVYKDGTPLKVGSPIAFFRIGQKYDQTDGVNRGLVSLAAGADNNIEVLVPLSFVAGSSVAPTDTLIDGRFTDTLQFFVTWDVAGVLATGEDGVLSITSGQLDLYIEDTEPFPIKNPFWSQREVETQLDGVLTSKGTRMVLPVTPGAVLRSIQLRALDAGVPSDAILNAITIRVNGNEKPVDTIGADFERAKSDHTFGNAAAAARPTGTYHVELAENGRVASTGLGGSGTGVRLNSLDLILDTTVGVGATSIIAHTVEHLPPGII
jgi:hypothetical protein